jgi:hypothetical protein
MTNHADARTDRNVVGMTVHADKSTELNGSGILIRPHMLLLGTATLAEVAAC